MRRAGSAQNNGHIWQVVKYNHDPGIFSVLWERPGKDFQVLRLEDAQFSHSGPQRAAVEPKDLSRPVFPADLPLRLLEDPHNMLTLNRFERSLSSR